MRLISRDLRGLLAGWESDGLLLRVSREVEPKHELAAVTKRIQAERNLPVIFENVRGTGFPVVSNVFGNYAMVSEVLGASRESIAARWAELTAAGGDPEVLDEEGEAPERMEVDFDTLPHLIFCEKDAGPYLTAGVVMAKDPDTGVPNLSYHRMQIIGGGEVRTRLNRAGDLFRIQQKAEKQGKNLEVAVLIGNPPAVTMAAAAPIMAGASELDLAERFAGRRLPRYSCATVSLQPPAECEFIIEGEIIAGVRRPEGPFGEWMDYYVPVMENHVLQIKRVTARKGAHFHAILAGSTEELTLSAIPNASLIYQAIKAFDHSVLDVSCYPSPQFCVVKIRKSYEGQAAKAMLGAFGAETNRMLYCVVVDEDVNIHDLKDVLWAMSTRCRPDRKIHIIPNVPSFARDPHETHWGRVGIDATAPLEWPAEFERKRYPGLDAIRLSEYF